MHLTQDQWDPEQYERFRHERERPVYDLVSLLQPATGGHVADLGCGTGRYTPLVHDHVGAATSTGIDTSQRMLDQTTDHTSADIRFHHGDIADLDGTWDVLFANASLQWLRDHDRLLPRLVSRLRPGGQFAFQVPANFDHPSHTIADDVGRDFGLAPLDRAIGALAPARYAEILWGAGLRDLDVSLRIYGVDMARTDDVIEWVSGTLLTRFERRLSTERFREFKTEYRRRLLERLDDPTGTAPYFYAFPRILCWGRLPR